LNSTLSTNRTRKSQTKSEIKITELPDFCFVPNKIDETNTNVTSFDIVDELFDKQRIKSKKKLNNRDDIPKAFKTYRDVGR